MSNDDSTAEHAHDDRTRTDEAVHPGELQDTDLDQVTGAGYPAGDGSPIDLGRWGLGR